MLCWRPLIRLTGSTVRTDGIVTTTPTQALLMMNGKWLLDRTSQLGKAG